MDMNMIDAFAGIGMFSLGAHWAGIETEAFIEWDEGCQRVLRKNFPNKKIYGDIKNFDGKKYTGEIDIVCGGFPCQPYSIAGKREGNQDDRDQWPQLLRVCNEVKPSWFIGENVANILNMEPERFISDLESIGYEAAIFDFPACAFGLQTMERHVWFIASPNKERCKRIGQKTVQDFSRLQREFQRSNKRILRRRDISKSQFRRVDQRNTNRLDKSSRSRLEQIGNSIPPQAAYILLKAIKLIHNS